MYAHIYLDIYIYIYIYTHTYIPIDRYVNKGTLIKIFPSVDIM
jgi:hypothetical protein